MAGGRALVRRVDRALSGGPARLAGPVPPGGAGSVRRPARQRPRVVPGRGRRGGPAADERALLARQAGPAVWRYRGGARVLAHAGPRGFDRLLRTARTARSEPAAAAVRGGAAARALGHDRG